MRTFYSEYVQHCMRFYSRHRNPVFRGNADKLDWYSCDNALKNFTDKERDLLLAVYREGDTVPDNVYNLSVALNINQDTIWKLVNELERKVAENRGLYDPL